MQSLAAGRLEKPAKLEPIEQRPRKLAGLVHRRPTERGIGIEIERDPVGTIETGEAYAPRVEFECAVLHGGDDIRDLMLESVEKRFGDQLPRTPVQWLSDNGSAYIAEQTRLFARQIGLQPVTTPVRSPQSNGMAESFVKTIKRDYVTHMPKPDRETALRNLTIAFEHYNEQHPHSALKYRSPREFRRLAAASL